LSRKPDAFNGKESKDTKKNGFPPSANQNILILQRLPHNPEISKEFFRKNGQKPSSLSYPSLALKNSKSVSNETGNFDRNEKDSTSSMEIFQTTKF
jgi:hypothetical protein